MHAQHAADVTSKSPDTKKRLNITIEIPQYFDFFPRMARSGAGEGVKTNGQQPLMHAAGLSNCGDSITTSFASFIRTEAGRPCVIDSTNQIASWSTCALFQ